ncbi:LysR family transcriptional regulator [Advenella kashmirensis]|nr:LysR family transcriptional regulator [Advenella kashmirensis]
MARAESVSKAAEKLHVTQPAVSTQLRQLEDAWASRWWKPMAGRSA